MTILSDIKKLLGIHEAIDDFDVDVVIAINTAFFYLHTIGVGPEQPFKIELDGEEDWSDFSSNIEAVKSYIFISTRLVFDRPETSYGIQALERQKDRLEWTMEIVRRSHDGY